MCCRGWTWTMLEEFQRLQSEMKQLIGIDFRKQIEHEMTGPQIYLMDVLRKNGPLKMSDLAEELSVTLGAVTMQADRLLKNGWIERSRSHTDRRVVMLAITDEGQRLLEHVIKAHQCLLNQYFGKLDAQEQAELIRLYKKMLG
jgi:DNA-binding MarR family transcriptional regulator